MTDRTIWAISDGRVGMVNQALGLAEAVADLGNALADGPAWRIVEKTVAPVLPWSLLPAGIWPPGVAGTGRGGDRLEPPWPVVAIGCGRHAVGPVLHVKRRSWGRTFIVQAQHPRTAAGRFDLIVSQSHDQLGGRNVLTILGSTNRVTEARLREAGARFAGRFADLPRPLVAVMIGGTNSCYRITPAVARRLADELRRLLDETGGSLLVTTSRRTGAENEATLRAALSGPSVRFWSGEGENPYFAYLALADAIIVTSDSVNMVSEACFTGKPVLVATLDGGNGKFERFHAEMHAAGHTRPFRGRLERWSPPPLDETRRAAAEVLRRFRATREDDGDRSPHCA